MSFDQKKNNTRGFRATSERSRISGKSYSGLDLLHQIGMMGRQNLIIIGRIGLGFQLRISIQMLDQ